jgi:hypothetical protein
MLPQAYGARATKELEVEAGNKCKIRSHCHVHRASKISPTISQVWPRHTRKREDSVRKHSTLCELDKESPELMLQYLEEDLLAPEELYT